MTSLRSIINAKCRECIYDPMHGHGNWRQQVEACTSLSCPIYPARPVSKPETREQRKKRLSRRQEGHGITPESTNSLQEHDQGVEK